jgi:hypothetical protein
MPEEKFIEINPTWEQSLNAMYAVLLNGDAEGRKMIREEFRRMAQAADLYNKMIKEENTK